MSVSWSVLVYPANVIGYFRLGLIGVGCVEGDDCRFMFWILQSAMLDLVDGWIARRLNQESAFGAVLDQTCDMLLYLALFSRAMYSTQMMVVSLLLSLEILCALLSVAVSCTTPKHWKQVDHNSFANVYFANHQRNFLSALGNIGHFGLLSSLILCDWDNQYFQGMLFIFWCTSFLYWWATVVLIKQMYIRLGLDKTLEDFECVFIFTMILPVPLMLWNQDWEQFSRFLSTRIFLLVTYHFFQKTTWKSNRSMTISLVFVFQSILYSELGSLLSRLHPPNTPMANDVLVRQLENHVFNGLPSMYLTQNISSQTIINWIIGEVMHFAYCGLYWIPFSISFAFQNNKSYKNLCTSFALSWFLSCVMYLTFPVAGPTHSLPRTDLQASGYLARIIRTLSESGASPGTALPSSHCSITTSLTASALLYHNSTRVKIIHSIATLFLVVSTVWCGYHYVLDAILGVIIAICSSSVVYVYTNT